MCSNSGQLENDNMTMLHFDISLKYIFYVFTLLWLVYLDYFLSLYRNFTVPFCSILSSIGDKLICR